MNKLSTAWNLAVGIYMTIGGFTMPYFLWQSAGQHSFGRWVLDFLVIVPLKSLAWPYFLFA